MKKQLTVSSFCMLIVAAITFIAFTPQQGEKGKGKKQQQNQGNKEVKNNQGNKEAKGNQGNKEAKGNSGKKDVLINPENNDYRDNTGKGNNGKGNDDKSVKAHRGKDYGYDWDPTTFKDRKKFRNHDKVAICHKFNRNNEPAVTINVSSNAVKAHLNHGDVLGNCPTNPDNRYSDDFSRKRADYYNYLQQSQEQVVYSQSILDYARLRLNDARSQLVVYQNDNRPPAYIEQKQATVYELEQNVSLLERLIGGAAQLLVSRFL